MSNAARLSVVLVAAFGIGGAALAASPSDMSATTPLDLTYRSTNPWLISAETFRPGVFLDLGGAFAALNGRTLTLKEGMIGGSPTDTLLLWFDRQDWFFKGRSTGRAYNNDSLYGVRWVFKKPVEEGDLSWALQLEGVSPTDLAVQNPTTEVTYFSTNVFSIGALASKGENHASLTYTRVNGANSSAHSDSVFLGYRRRLANNGRSQFDAQLAAGAQRIDYVGTRTNIRAYGELLYGYQFTPNVGLDADLTVFPAGLAITSGRTLGVASFLVYRPGGTVNDLNDKVIGYASLRLTARF